MHYVINLDLVHVLPAFITMALPGITSATLHVCLKPKNEPPSFPEADPLHTRSPHHSSTRVTLNIPFTSYRAGRRWQLSKYLGYRYLKDLEESHRKYAALPVRRRLWRVNSPMLRFHRAYESRASFFQDAQLAFAFEARYPA
jgi:hypothetical protein